MYEVRMLVESYAAKLAADLVPDIAIKSVLSNLLRLNAEGDRINVKALSEAGHDLHCLIVENCGNRVLAQSILSLRDHFAHFRSLSLQIPEKVISSHAEHIRIAEALCARDGKLAEKLVQAHFDHAARSLVDSLLKPSAESRTRLIVSE
jgi:DNA-binding GntR family transcriptional regulator